MFMFRKGRFKLVEYAGERPQLFDLEADPGERHDLATDPAMAGRIAELQVARGAICDVDAVNARAFADQAARIAEHGGAEAILQGTDIPHTPAPV